uniref:Ribosomal protein n=1 Tax=Mycena chlorophos TaxID=658473 RepID=A0ABQ0LHB2_MYCCL|nr:ribosomal protein [Mycena chlorophos]
MLSLLRQRAPQIAPRYARCAVSLSDGATASDAMQFIGAAGLDEIVVSPVKVEVDEEIPDWMLLPSYEDIGRRRNKPILMNVPPPEDPLLHMLASHIMRHGERAKATRTVSRTLLHIFTLTRAPPLPILREAVLYASPAVKTVTKTHGARVVSTPMALSEKQRTHYGIKQLLDACDSRPGRKLEERLAREAVDILQKVHVSIEAGQKSGETKWGGALDKKNEQHKLAMVNRGTVRINPRDAKTADGIAAPTA